MESVKVLVKASGKHIHIGEEDFYKIFGPDEKLNVKKMMGAGQFVSDKKVTLRGPKGETTVSIIGPFHKESQIEMSYTEARAIGLRPPLRDSGKLEGSDPITIIGPLGSVDVKEGVIVSRRHIHMKEADMEALGVDGGDFVWVRMGTDRELLFGQVLVRRNPGAERSTMHIDFDEMNAAGLTEDTWVEVFREVEVK